MSEVQVSNEMEKQRSRIGQAVDAVKDSSVPGQHGSTILAVQVTLYRGYRDVAEEPTHTDEDAGQSGLTEGERREIRSQQDRQCDRVGRPGACCLCQRPVA